MQLALGICAGLVAAACALPPPPAYFAGQAPRDVDSLPFGPATQRLALALYSESGSVTVPRVGKPQPYVVHVGVVADPRYFAIELPATGCEGSRDKTSVTAAKRNCTYATNAGFFSFTAKDFCIGNLVSDGQKVQSAGKSEASFGLTAGGRIVTGFLNSTADPGGDRFLQLIGGVGWLVRGGEVNVDSSPDLNPSSTFFTERAPRTAVGAFANGSVVLVQVDGEEDIGAGLAVDEFAHVISGLGVHTAINLDGGGSSVSVYNGAVVSKPTCSDTKIICERQVSTITCAHPYPVNDVSAQGAPLVGDVASA